MISEIVIYVITKIFYLCDSVIIIILIIFFFVYLYSKSFMKLWKQLNNIIFFFIFPHKWSFNTNIHKGNIEYHFEIMWYNLLREKKLQWNYHKRNIKSQLNLPHKTKFQISPIQWNKKIVHHECWFKRKVDLKINSN